MNTGQFKWTPVKSVLLALFGAAMSVAIYRLFVGLGPVTNLSDTAPWGLWKAFDVIVVVPLGASGFTMAFVRYILKADQYEHIMRRSVIWAALMYLSMGLRLMFDLGRPWRLPYPIIFWGNIHSPLFEVAWCVFLYLIVLFLENLPRVTERIGAQWAQRLEHGVHRFAPAFVLVGVLLSTMHQSSLGTLYMIVGKRIDPLWYHPWLNYIYLLTAIATGLSVVILIEHVSNKVYGTPFQMRLLAPLGAAAAIFLAIALAWRIGSLWTEGSLGLIFQARSATFWWWTEMLTGYVLPLLLLARGPWRQTRGTLVTAAGAIVTGMVIMRLNVVFTAMNEAMGANYFPSLMEWIFTIGMTAGTLFFFAWFAEKLPGILGRDDAHAAAPMAGDD